MKILVGAMIAFGVPVGALMFMSVPPITATVIGIGHGLWTMIIASAMAETRVSKHEAEFNGWGGPVE